ncbi:hypothetical protein IWW57_003464 [Coemansia sp. S610]|nr:hypothetical protein IWW57_003464 [Coemansia sp. S610]
MANGNIGTTSATYTDVTRTNIRSLYWGVSAQIAKAKFLAIDTEFTGLVLSNASRVFNLKTTEWVTRATDMREKYRAMSNVAKTHALVAMGLSTFSTRHTRPGSYNVHNFNFLLQSQNSHLINPSSISFLAETGFDLGRQATKGIRYFSGPNPKPVEVKNDTINEEGYLIREVFLDIVRAGVPLVTHNGLFDLVYLYQSFFGPLPDTYESFAFDLSEMFPGGIYDTKIIAEKETPQSASYLAYLFHKSERLQKRRLEGGESALTVKLRDSLVKGSSEPRVRCHLLRSDPPTSKPYCEKPYCETFAQHGNCRYGKRCFKTHDINFILDCQEKEAAAEEELLGAPTVGASVESDTSDKKRKRDDDMDVGGADSPCKLSRMDTVDNLQETVATVAIDGPATEKQDVPVSTPPGKSEEANGSEPLSLAAEPSLNMYHTAAYDAFMTGYIFASYRLMLEDKMSNYRNKVYIMGSDNPLLIQAGPYARTSVTYHQTMRLMNAAAAAAAAADAAASVDATEAPAAEPPTAKAPAAEPSTTDVDIQQNTVKNEAPA